MFEILKNTLHRNVWPLLPHPKMEMREQPAWAILGATEYRDDGRWGHESNEGQRANDEAEQRTTQHSPLRLPVDHASGLVWCFLCA